MADVFGLLFQARSRTFVTSVARHLVSLPTSSRTVVNTPASSRSHARSAPGRSSARSIFDVT